MPSFEETTTLECLFYQVWNDFAFTFNFTSELEVSPPIDGLLFRVYVQKMLERIEAGLVHSSVMPLMMTSSRVAKNKFLWPIRSTRVPDVEINFSSYIQPFDRNLWMAMVAWLLSISAVAVSFKFLIISLLLKKKFRFLTDAGDDLMTTFSALCSQGVNDELYHTMLSLRILLILTHLVPLLLLPSYSGALISFLSNPPAGLPFTNLKEFEDTGKYKLMAVGSSYDETYIRTGEKFARVREKDLLMEENELPRSDEQGFELICQRKVSYFVGQPVLMRDPPKCKVFNLDESFGTFVSAMAVSLDFPLKEHFNRVLVKRFTCGVRLKHEEKILRDSLNIDMVLLSKTSSKHFLNSASFDSVKPFTLQDVLPIFTVFSCGLVLTVVTFMCERYLWGNL